MAGKAFVILNHFVPVSLSSSTQIGINYEAAMGDGVTQPKVISSTFTFDAALTAAQNVANLKAATVALCGLNGISLTVADVSVLSAIN